MHTNDVSIAEMESRSATSASEDDGLGRRSFLKGMGVTGVLILAESHLSIHSWPELEYAAVDVFVCGKADPHRAIASLVRAFEPRDTKVTEHLRGELAHA